MVCKAIGLEGSPVLGATAFWEGVHLTSLFLMIGLSATGVGRHTLLNWVTPGISSSHSISSSYGIDCVSVMACLKSCKARSAMI